MTPTFLGPSPSLSLHLTSLGAETFITSRPNVLVAPHRLPASRHHCHVVPRQTTTSSAGAVLPSRHRRSLLSTARPSSRSPVQSSAVCVVTNRRRRRRQALTGEVGGAAVAQVAASVPLAHRPAVGGQREVDVVIRAVRIATVDQ